MDVLTAHAHFASCTADELQERFEFDGEIEMPTVGICTPAALAGGCALSGMFYDAVDDHDLKECLSHFFSCLEADIIGLDAWTEASLEVVNAVLEWGHERERAAAPYN